MVASLVASILLMQEQRNDIVNRDSANALGGLEAQNASDLKRSAFRTLNVEIVCRLYSGTAS